MSHRPWTAALVALLALTLCSCGAGPDGQDPYPGQPLGLSPTAIWFGLLVLAVIVGWVAVMIWG